VSAPRLVHVGNVIVDVVMAVPALPVAGSDVLATAAAITVGAGFNVMAAAHRQGMPVVHGGVHGTGAFGDRVRAQLAAEGIEVARPARPGPDTGFCVALVDATGERTFVTSRGAEATLDAADLAVLDVRPGDVVYVSGYSLLSPTAGPAVVAWLAALPDAAVVVVDPQPLVADVPRAVLDPVLARADWWTCNAAEATATTGAADPAAAAQLLAGLSTRAHVLVRTGADGCLLLERGGRLRPVPAYAVPAVDTNGAGDAHVGVFVAALASGASPYDSADRANAAAALATTRPGPATAPGRDELELFLADRARPPAPAVRRP